MNRKQFFRVSGMGLAAAAVGLSACDYESDATSAEEPVAPPRFEGEWGEVRAHFDLDPEVVHLAGLLIASNPEPVQRAIEEHRRELNNNPAVYLEANFTPQENEVRAAAARYMGANAGDVALTHSTTMGISLVYNGLDISEGQEILTTDQDYYSTHEAVGYKARRSGASERRVSLYAPGGETSVDELVERLVREIRPETRVLALTWVHSSTGLKLPIRAMADEIRRINAGRDQTDQVLMCVDGVHGFGVEHDSIPDLGCDFFMAGTHKWIFAPRGTGVLWGHPRAQHAVTPTVPTFSRADGWGPRMTPGGFHAFEHWWGMKEAFEFHMDVGKERITDRIHALNRQFKEGVREMDHVTLYTPLEENLSAGIVCFDIDGLSPAQVEQRLRNRNVIMGETPYSPSYARVSPGIINSEHDIERALAEIRDLG